jgi:multicomponent Na+:H+ antiporter subunit F
VIDWFVSLMEVSFLLVLVYILFATYRVLKGPHQADRVVGFSTINTMVVAAMFLFGAMQGSVVYVDVAIVYCTLSFVGTLFIARYLEGGF